jgi:hypothetical protein
MTIETRMQRVMDAIEDTPAAIDLRSIALEAFVDGPLRNLDEINDYCREAAQAVVDAHPELGVDAKFLHPYIASQVRALATGEQATLLLPPRDRLN